MGDKTAIRRGTIGEPKVVPVRDYQWTDAARERFLDHLAATCNVRAACAAAGRHHTGAYALRRRDPGFAAQWHAALESGYDTLEAAILEQTLAPLQPETVSGGAEEDADAGPPLPGADFDIDRALKLLAMHRAREGRATRPARTGGPRPRRATEEETNAAILKQIDLIEARRRPRPPA